MGNTRVLVLTRPSRPSVLERVQAVLAELDGTVEVVNVADGRDTRRVEPGSADVAVVFGGDGTFLGAARRLCGAGMPVVGVNMGRMGFLTEFSVDEFRRHSRDILSGRMPLAHLMMLDVRICRGADTCFTSPAMNEVSVLAGPPFRMIELSVVQEDQAISTFLGDGLIVATPTGSTGYTLSAGGPIVEPRVEALTLTPVAAHSLALRPVVLSADETLTITPLRANPGTAASIDGQVSTPLQEGDRVEVRRGPHRLPVVKNPAWPFFRTLSSKLQWGRSPHHHSP